MKHAHLRRLAAILARWECRRYGDYVTWTKPDQSSVRVVAVTDPAQPGEVRMSWTRPDGDPEVVARWVSPGANQVGDLVRGAFTTWWTRCRTR